MHVLLIEDDKETSSYVAGGLRQEGHRVDIAQNGIDGLHLALESSPDILIVDRMLPGIDGISMVKALRSSGHTVPVLFLTALGTVEDRVAGLDAGGDDYLVKPFAFSELMARANALLRRPPLQAEATTLSIANYTIDRLRRRVIVGNEELALQPREFQLLDYLLQHSGRVVTRTMLLEAIWGFDFDPGSNIVESHISRLRTKLEKGGGAVIIQTIRGAGYLIDADV